MNISCLYLSFAVATKLAVFLRIDKGKCMTQKTNFQSIVAHYFKRFGTATPKAAFSLRKDTKLIVTIPSHNEPDVLKTLDSLKNCIPTQYPVEVLIIFNQSETADVDLVAFHQQSCQRVLQ